MIYCQSLSSLDIHYDSSVLCSMSSNILIINVYVSLSRIMPVTVCLIKINSYYYHYISLHNNPEMEASISTYFTDKEIKPQRS